MELKKQDLTQCKFEKKLKRQQLIQSEFENWIKVKENRAEIKQKLKNATLEGWYDFIEEKFIETGKISQEIYENSKLTIFQWFRAAINYFRSERYQSLWYEQY